MKRKDYLSWEEYFMGLAILSAERSKDPSTQVGACIVDENNKIISVGYNGAPIGYDDDKDMTWERDGNFLDTKYAYVVHAEVICFVVFVFHLYSERNVEAAACVASQGDVEISCCVAIWSYAAEVGFAFVYCYEVAAAR